MTPAFHCPYCGSSNDYSAQICRNCTKDISQVPRSAPPTIMPPPVPASAVDTVKTSTIILLILTVFLSFVPPFIWGIVCGVGAYFSYKSPNKSWPLTP